MESLNKINDGTLSNESAKERPHYIYSPSIIIAAFIIASAWVYTANLKVNKDEQAQEIAQNEPAEKTLVIPLARGDLGLRMIEAGVIDQQAFEAIYANRGGLTKEEKDLLTGQTNDLITVNQKNRFFWFLRKIT